MDENTALVLVDVQRGLGEAHFGARAGGDVEGRLLRLLAAWRERRMPIFHVQHSSTEPDSPLRPERAGFAFKPGFEPQAGEAHLVKQVNSGFIGTDLEARLHARAIRRVVIGGLTTNHCVSTTTRMAANLGFAVVLVRDGVGAFAGELDGEQISADLIQKVSLANLSGEFATLLTAQEILATL